MRSTLLGLLVALAACGGSSAKRSGESCFASSDCEDGLVCDMGRDPNVCAPTSTIMVDAAAPDASDDAGADAAGPDSSMPADASPDGPRPDATPIDAAIDAAIDAPPMIDAAEPDAPVDADIDAM